MTSVRDVAFVLQSAPKELLKWYKKNEFSGDDFQRKGE
jgi:hypothetical protein